MQVTSERARSTAVGRCHCSRTSRGAVLEKAVAEAVRGAGLLWKSICVLENTHKWSRWTPTREQEGGIVAFPPLQICCKPASSTPSISLGGHRTLPQGTFSLGWRRGGGPSGLLKDPFCQLPHQPSACAIQLSTLCHLKWTPFPLGFGFWVSYARREPPVPLLASCWQEVCGPGHHPGR